MILRSGRSGSGFDYRNGPFFIIHNLINPSASFTSSKFLPASYLAVFAPSLKISKILSSSSISSLALSPIGHILFIFTSLLLNNFVLELQFERMHVIVL